MVNCRYRARVVCLMLCLAGWAGQGSVAAEPGTEKQRSPWRTSQFRGTPHPPPPYRERVAFEHLSFDRPVTLTSAPGTSRLFVVQLDGKVFSFPEDPNCVRADPFFDLKTAVPELTSTYGMTFHPDFPRQPYIYICYVLPGEAPDGSVIARFTVVDEEPPRVDPASELILFRWKAGGHNGCSLKFGPDGFLYISTGDGTGPNPPDGLMAGQDLSNPLSCILRIDVDQESDGRNYAIPEDNPFVDLPGAMGEIWAYGFRNPWKMSFDRQTGELWLGDVGWDTWELVHRVERGGNYGWSITEGSQPIHPTAERGPTPIVPPITQHDHSEAHSITGGFVYRGQTYPDLHGAYVYGDYSTGKIWSLRVRGTEVVERRELADTPLQIIAWAETNDGELYFMDYERTNRIYRLARNPATDFSASFPRKLSETGLFASVADHIPADGVLTYEVNAPYWADNTYAVRMLGLPGSAQIAGGVTGKWSFPDGTVAARTVLSRPPTAGAARRLETQVLHKWQETWHPYTYVWNEAQDDAELAPAEGLTIDSANRAGGTEQSAQPYYVLSRAECKLCHSIKHGAVLGLAFPQIHRDISLNDRRQSQIQHWYQNGVFAQSWDASARHPRPLAGPHDSASDLAERARSYLHVNCNHCHSPGGGGTSTLHLAYHLPIERTGIVGQAPSQGTFGLANAGFIVPGRPLQSVLLYRMLKVGPGRMPHVGSLVVDRRGVSLIHDWIQSMASREPEDVGQPDLDALLGELEAADLADDVPIADQVRELLASPRGAYAAAIRMGQGDWGDALRAEVAHQAADHPAAHVRDLLDPFLPPAARRARLGPHFAPKQVLALEGDVARGRQLYWYQSGLNCRTCHRIEAVGGEVGPDLSRIAQENDAAALLEAIANPAAKVVEDYRATVVRTSDGLTRTGRIVAQDARHVTILTAENQRFSLLRKEIEEQSPSETSLMPDNLLAELTPQQAADLLAYLMTLR